MLNYTQFIEFLTKCFLMRLIYNHLYNKSDEYAPAYFYSIFYLGWDYNIYIIILLFFLNKVFSSFSNLNEKKIILIIFFLFQIILAYFFFGMSYFLLYEHFWKIFWENIFIFIFNNLLVLILVKIDFYGNWKLYRNIRMFFSNCINIIFKMKKNEKKEKKLKMQIKKKNVELKNGNNKMKIEKLLNKNSKKNGINKIKKKIKNNSFHEIDRKKKKSN